MKDTQAASRKKKHLVEFFIFFLFLLLVDRGLFHIIQAIERNYFKRKDFKKIFGQPRDFNKNFTQLPKDTYNTLIMGSSRTHRGIHPLYIYEWLNQKAFKIARGKINVKFNYYFYKEYKEAEGVPEVVIYGVDYFIFHQKSAENFLQFLGIKNNNEYIYKNGFLLLLSNKERIDTFFNNMLDTLNKIYFTDKNKKKMPIIDPFIGYEKMEAFDERKPPHHRTFGYDPYPGEEGIYFTRLLEAWEADGVQVLLVFLPDYIGTYESNHQGETFKKEIHRLAKPYTNVSIYNYNRPEAFPLTNADYFLDGGYGKANSHLSRRGARVFNRMLVKDLKKHYGKQ